MTASGTSDAMDNLRRWPQVVGHEVNPETNGDAVWVRMSDEPNDVIHLDCRPNERLTDAEAIEVAEYMRAVSETRDRKFSG